MKRDWQAIDSIYQRLLETVYTQPQDEGHFQLASRAIAWAAPHPKVDLHSVLDLGAGEGFCMDILRGYGTEVYLGISLGADVANGRKKGRRLWEADFNFLPDTLTDGFTFGISRHSLEHSPFPIMTLCHWKNFVTKHLLIVLPHPDWYKFRGQNHFSVASPSQAENWFEQSGWTLVDQYVDKRHGNPDRVSDGETPHELWYLLKNGK